VSKSIPVQENQAVFIEKLKKTMIGKLKPLDVFHECKKIHRLTLQRQFS